MGQVVILGTGGTIAGTGDDPQRAWAYRAAQLPVDALRDRLVAAVPALAEAALSTRQVAQIDSKDMDWSVWRAVARAIGEALAQDDVDGVVVTHGTDTLEETAYLLHRLADGQKPVVLTAAMRPATATNADGPANLRDAVRVVQEAARRGLGGVVVAMHGRVWSGADVRKSHSHAVDAFDGGGEAPLLHIGETGQWRAARAWQASGGLGWGFLPATPPRVELVHSHAGADGWLVRAALAHAATHGALDGIVVASTGHGTLHTGLEAALAEAHAAGVTVWRSSRVARGGVTPREGDIYPAGGPLTAAQARVALMLHLLASAGSPL